MIQESIQSRAELIPRNSNHIIQGGGKRIRPTLLIASARACGYRGKRILSLGAAVELLHSATLLHDDVVDCSQNRRGRPAAHTVFCNSASILVGDFILAKGVSLIVDNRSIEILKPLAGVIVRLAEGEALQLARRGSIPQESEYLTIITQSTIARQSSILGDRTPACSRRRSTMPSWIRHASSDAIDKQITSTPKVTRRVRRTATAASASPLATFASRS